MRTNLWSSCDACAIYVVLLCLVACTQLAAQPKDTLLPQIPIFSIAAETSYIELGRGLEYYEDKNAQLKFAQVSSPSFQASWQAFTKSQTLSFGFKRSAYWIRFRLQNLAPKRNDLLLEIGFPPLDSIELFVQGSDGNFSRWVMGDYLPFSMRDVQHRTFVRRLDIADTVPCLVYLRVKSTSSMMLPLNIYRNDKFIERSNASQLYFGWIFGTLVILIGYHCVLYIFTKERSYIFYVLYMVSVFLYVLTFNGFSAQYLFPNSGKWLQYTTLLFVGLPQFGLVLFTQAFLHTRKQWPRLHQVLSVLAIFLLVVVAAGLFADYLTINIIVSATIFPIAGSCYGIAFYIIRHQQRHQYQYFLVGSLSLIVGAIIASLMVLGIVPNNALTRNSVQIGAVVESVLFALALSQRYKTLQDEKERAQAETLRLQRDANELLQLAVQERTAELNERNGDLERANKEIQRQMLIQSEKSEEIEVANTVLQEQNEELQTLNREKNEIVGMVSHDLKNPIATMRALAELMQSGFVEQKQVPEMLGKIVGTADRMLDLVKNLLEVNRLEQGGMQFNLVPLDIAPIIESTLWQYQSAADAKNITLHYISEASSTLAFVDEQAIIQVLDNIVSNAVKYSPHGKNVFVYIKSNNNTVRIECQDEGPGISAEDMKKLFGKFMRLSARPTGGEHSTGLGLSIVKKMVEAMNGRVWCESELGDGLPTGATFIVELPTMKKETI